ncbi:MAG: zinc-dependent alcohol dehydrogenase family protein [Methyloversatilis discipulorum]|uniref:zinc-dependent alcohol dehydrogenase family protein n=1 Tax=Methyloversatilis discipulorum TaxID=1119528 RepID=UPI0026F1C2D4|nr:zinc-dependent alcohol dehydrogenase family protein [Methyloversatilis discipulorum]MBV5285778.1 zinc-dependent alcohol dehydrogenase family protein [Methyloversatilis discipulorum]
MYAHTPTMQVLTVEAIDGPFVRCQQPRPQPAPGQVLVKIAASGVNPLDTKIRAGKAAHARHPLPAVLGMDMAGTVLAVGEGVTRFRPGDAVFGMTGGVGGVPGTLAEYQAVDADLLALKPAALSMADAAALPLVFITAWEGLVDRARVKRGDRVLIHGGAGGVGHVAVQIAVSRGARVYATVSARDVEATRRLGVVPIDYRRIAVADYVGAHTAGEGFDVVYDTVGGTTLDDSFAAVRTYGGHVVSCLGWGTHALAPLSFRAATYSGVFTLLPLLTGKGRAHHGAILAEAARMAAAGELRVRRDDRRFTLDDVEAAHARLRSGEARGKIVIELE